MRASSGSVASLSTDRAAQDAAVAVRGVLAQADVGDDRQLVAGRTPQLAIASWTIPSSAQAPEPSASLASGRPKRRTDRTPAASSRSASRGSSSTLRRYWPGIEPISSRTPRPGCTKSGATSMAGCEARLAHEARGGRACGAGGGRGRPGWRPAGSTAMVIGPPVRRVIGDRVGQADGGMLGGDDRDVEARAGGPRRR